MNSAAAAAASSAASGGRLAFGPGGVERRGILAAQGQRAMLSRGLIPDP